MKRIAYVGVLLAFSLSAAPSQRPTTGPTTQSSVADISGRVSIAGAVALRPIDLTRAVIYLDADPTLDAVPMPAEHATIAQRHKAFTPNFAVVRKGTTVEFPNWDDFDHNVFSLSKAAPAFDLDRYPKGQSKSRVFDKVGVVQVFCNIHPKMRAVVFVTPNPYAARPDTDGKFVIQGVPPGRYTLVVWHDRADEVRTAVTVASAGKAITVDVPMQAARRSASADESPRQDGPAYGVDRGLGVKREQLNLPVVPDAHPAPDPEPGTGR